MALKRFQDTFGKTLPDGDVFVLAGATVTVRLESTGAIASIFQDKDGVTPKSNPFNADSNGFAFFYADDGVYRITATGNGQTVDLRDEPVGVEVETSTGTQALDAALDQREVWVTDLAALKAIPIAGLTANQAAKITTTGRAGSFTWMTGDQSANVTADPQEGVWVAPAGETGLNGAWMRLYSLWEGVDVNWFGAVADGVTNDGPAFNKAVSYASGKGDKVYVPAATYLVEDEIVLPNKMSISGVPTSSVNNKTSIIIHGGTTSLLTTDSLDRGFQGLSIAHFRIKGGVTGKWAIESHYPFTSIEGIHVEDESPRYLGNGIRLHHDNGTSGMGCWNSRIRDCRVVLDEDGTNKRIGFDLHINGGDVTVDSCQATFPEKGFYLRAGERVTFVNCGTNKIRDFTSTAGNIVNAAFVIGDGTNKLESITIRGCYVEGHDRAIIVNANVTNTSIKENYITDIKFNDPALSGDGCILLKDGYDGVSIDDNYISMGYRLQSLVRSERTDDATTNGWSHKGNKYVITRDQAGFDYQGTRFPKAPEFAYKNSIKQIEDTITTYIKDESFTRLSDRGALSDGASVTLFTTSPREEWDVVAYQEDSPTFRRESALVIEGSNGSADVFKYLTATGLSISTSGSDVILSNTSGGTRAYAWTARKRY